MTLKTLVSQIRGCTECAAHLPNAPNPVFRVGSAQARILIIGQAPGAKAHLSGTPWNDASGDRLRDWLQVSRAQFDDPTNIALMPMGFCYPGTGKSGDLPPRPECAPRWHDKILKHLPQVELTLLIGQYAHAHYLGERRRSTLTETVKAWREYAALGFVPLVHPSPRNQIWLKKNPWFAREVLPALQKTVARLMKEAA